MASSDLIIHNSRSIPWPAKINPDDFSCSVSIPHINFISESLTELFQILNAPFTDTFYISLLFSSTIVRSWWMELPIQFISCTASSTLVLLYRPSWLLTQPQWGGKWAWAVVPPTVALIIRGGSRNSRWEGITRCFRHFGPIFYNLCVICGLSPL